MSKSNLALFDIGNVVVRASHMITWAILEDMGVVPERARRFFTIPAYSEFSRDRISESEFCQAERDALEVPLSDRQIYAAHQSHIYMVDPAVMGILAQLRDDRIRLAFVTNTNMWQTVREKELVNLESNFGQVVRSNHLHLLKTDSGAWPTIIQQLGVNPQDAASVFLIDDSEANLVAARAQMSGIATYCFNPKPNVGTEQLRSALLHQCY